MQYKLKFSAKCAITTKIRSKPQPQQTKQQHLGIVHNFSASTSTCSERPQIITHQLHICRESSLRPSQAGGWIAGESEARISGIHISWSRPPGAAAAWWRDRGRTVKTQFESIGEHIKYNKILASRASGQNIHKNSQRKTSFGNERVERIKAPVVVGGAAAAEFPPTGAKLPLLANLDKSPGTS